MKSSGKRGGKGKGKAVPQPPAHDGGDSRKRFLQVLGAGTVGASSIDAAFISQAFGASSTVEELPRSAVPEYLNVAASKSLHPEMVPQLEAALNKAGLQRVDSIARVYQITSPAGVQKKITVIPFHPTERTAGTVGSIGISEGSSPSSVSVKLDGTRVVSFTTYDVLFGKLVERTFTPKQLQGGAGALVERNLPRERVVPDISVAQSASVAEQTFRTLLAEEQKTGEYTAAQVQGFLTNLPSIRLMAQLQYARHKGLTMSPGNACCSCCSCCWGCCSCTSAVSSSYLSDRYRSRAGRQRSAT